MKKSLNIGVSRFIISAMKLLLLVLTSVAVFLSATGCSSNKHCEVHGTGLQRDRVPIVRGPVDLNRWEASKDFPNAYSQVGGSCIVGWFPPRTAKVLYCNLCREAEAEWLAARDVAD